MKMWGDRLNDLAHAVSIGNIEAAKRLIDIYGLSYSPKWLGGYVLLCNALLNRNRIMAKLLLNKGSSVNSSCTSQEGSVTPLHLAAKNGYPEIVAMLLDRQAIVNVKGRGLQTPLIDAISGGCLETVKLLLDGGANINETGMHGSFPLVCAINVYNSDNLPMVELLLRMGADVNGTSKRYESRFHAGTRRDNGDKGTIEIVTVHNDETPLLAAIRRDNGDKVVMLLLDKGANVNVTDRYNETPLHAAIRMSRNRDKVVKFLLDRGANVNVTGQNNETPLHVAIRQRDDKVVKLLLDMGANVNVTGRDDETPLHVAIRCYHTDEVVKLLLDKGANVNATGREDETPLHVAIRYDRGGEVVKWLLDKGANVNATDQDDETPLHAAVGNRNSDKVIKWLLDKGANVNATDQNDETPLHAAIRNRNSDEVVKLLLDKGANLNGAYDEPPLHVAIRENNKVLVKLLLEMGADVDATGRDGATPICVAGSWSRKSVIEEILRFRPDMNNERNHGSLSVAIKARASREVVDVLLRHGFNIRAGDANDAELLYAAVEQGYLRIVKSLLKLGANANLPCDSWTNATPLQAAIHNNRSEVAELLLRHGANVNAKDYHGESAMSYAIEMGVTSTVQQLLLRSNANSRDIKDWLFTAVKTEDPEIVGTLLRSAPYIDVDTRDETGRTALHCVASLDPICCMWDEKVEGWVNSLVRAKIAEMLLNRGANVNAVDMNGKTALYLAAERGNDATVNVLFEHKADVDCLTEKNDHTPLGIAVHGDKRMVVKILLDCGANVNARMSEGLTALHIASREGRTELVTLLLDRGADSDSQDLQNWSPLHYAVMNGHPDSVRAILRHGTDVSSKELMTLLESVGQSSRRQILIMNEAKITEILERHIVAMKALDLHANDLNLRDFYMRHEHDSYLQICQREITKMKSNLIGGSNVSFHDVLTRDTKQLAVYARNKSIARALARENLADKFPTYFGMIARPFNQRQKRQRLLSSSAKSLNALSGYAIPDLPIIEIFKHLSNNDLEKLIKACPIGEDCRN